MAQEIEATKILNAEGSNPDPIDLEARLSEDTGNDHSHRGEMDFLGSLYQVAVTADVNHLKTLLDRNVDRRQLLLSPCDDEGNTCLHIAVMAGRYYFRLKFIECALEYEPKLASVRNGRGLTPLSLAAGSQYVDVGHVIWRATGDNVREMSKIKSIVMDTDDNEIAQELLQTRIPEDDIFEALFSAIRGYLLETVTMFLLDHNRWELGLGIRTYNGQSAFSCAAEEGNVSIGEEIIRRFSFTAALFFDSRGRSALHIAVEQGHIEFVTFILGAQRVSAYWPRVNLINQADDLGRTPLHLAAKHCRPRIVEALLADKKRQHFAVDNASFTALDVAYYEWHDQMSVFKWSEVVTHLSDAACPLTVRYGVRERAKRNFIACIRAHAKSVTGTHWQSTLRVGILITIVTSFAAAFTLSGGYISDKGPTEGLPVLSEKAALQAFLISNTLAMCSSLMATFICNMYRLSDVDFVLYCAKKIGYLMWFSYSNMAVAFATGLYAILAPTNLWLSISVCVLCGLGLLLSYFFVEWPVLKLDHQLRVLSINSQEL